MPFVTDQHDYGLWGWGLELGRAVDHWLEQFEIGRGLVERSGAGWGVGDLGVQRVLDLDVFGCRCGGRGFWRGGLRGGGRNGEFDVHWSCGLDGLRCHCGVVVAVSSVGELRILIDHEL